MKRLSLIGALLAVPAGAHPPRPTYPSCDLPAQHAVTGGIGGAIADAGQSHVSARSNVLQADIGSARKAGRLSRAQADRLWRRVDAIGGKVRGFVAAQGFLSAAERASYDRALDDVAAAICRP